MNTGYKISGCSGTVLEKWINHLESYFWEYHIQENQREPVVYLCLEGPTGIWISELRDRDPPNSWEELKQRLRRGADAMAKETNQPRYFGIRQDGSVSVSIGKGLKLSVLRLLACQGNLLRRFSCWG